jgi:hypothetical protein
MGPEFGVIDVMTGAEYVMSKICVFQHAFAVVQDPSIVPSAEPETTHTSFGLAGSWAAPE